MVENFSLGGSLMAEIYVSFGSSCGDGLGFPLKKVVHEKNRAHTGGRNTITGF